MIKYFGKKILTITLVLVTLSTFGQDFKELKGVVLDSDSKNPIGSAIVSLMQTNTSTVSNSEGDFTLKIDNNSSNGTLLISYPGYTNQRMPVTKFLEGTLEIYLQKKITQLDPIAVSSFKDAKNLVRMVFENKAKNHLDKSVLMTAFYRETIKRRRTNVSLTEAVVNLHKKPYLSNSRDDVELQVARKKTNYKKLDTLAFKLQGGPFSTLYLDIMKYPEYLFANDLIDDYEFSFSEPSTVNNRPVYVIDFKELPYIESLRYNGKLYIDAESLALTRAVYSLNLENSKQAERFFTKKKPRDVIVIPTETSYNVDYREKDGKWYYGYARLDLSFKVNKRRQLFNQNYTVSSEMAITDWEIQDEDKKIKFRERIKPSIILADRISGFTDPNFWGEYNLIEPEKSIESAIEKIRKQIEKEEKRKS